MKKISRLFLPLLLLTGLIAGCSTPRHTAPVVDMTTQSGSPRSGDAAAARAPEGPGYYTVKKGDTLLHIALDSGQSYRDLVSWNNITNPNDIRVDQVLRVAPPAGAAQTGSVTTGSGVEVRPLNASSSTATAPATTMPASVSSGSVATKTGPRGDKRAFSEAALAELQKPETNTTAPVAIATHGEPKAAEKQTESAAPQEDNVVFIWPAEGKVVGTFEEGKKGIDITGKAGQPVVAAGAGKVMYAGSGIRGYGNLVIVKHSNNLLSAYAHNKMILVKEGQSVARGEKIAEMGNSDSDRVKLHFEIRQQGKPVDPSKFLPSR